ncbi:hypothetical protein BGZ46_001035 [Entomortierella lignicola]|nr:hypothetical protein BGZ46_001035 [Entomortierella lignicola]
MDEQKKRWQEAIENLESIGTRAWRAAWKDWDKEKKAWEEKQSKRPMAEREKAFKRSAPTFKAVEPMKLWEALEVMVDGVDHIRNDNLDGDSDSSMALNVMADWTVQDLYHGLTPKVLASKLKRLYTTTRKIATYMAGRFVETIEGIGKSEIWKRRCEITIEWEREQGITTKDKRSRPRNDGEHRRNADDFMGQTLRHRHALDTLEIRKEADRRLLGHYQGSHKLDLMESLGSIKFTMTSDTG